MLKVSAQHIDEDRRRAEPGHDFGGRGEGEGRHEHRLARLDALRHQRQPQRVGAVGAAEHVLGAAEFGELRSSSATSGPRMYRP